MQSVLEQTYQNIEILVIDNNSSDNSAETARKILKESQKNQKIILNKKNLGYAGGNNTGIRESRGEYIVLLNVDTILDKNFVQEISSSFEKDNKIGSVQAKVYQLDKGVKTKIIDTMGFAAYKSGRIIDLGQGKEDNGCYNQSIFGANGVAPAYRRTALNDIELNQEYLDEDFFCYYEDVDLAWRLNWRGWSTVFNPHALVWHDRTSSKSVGGGWKEFRKIRKTQSLWMRRISWRNSWLTFIKNLPLKSFFRPQFLKRQIEFAFYLLIFEPKVLLAKFEIIKLLPKMLKKRKLIMKNKKANHDRLN